MDEIQDRLRNEAQGLLESGKIDAFLGYERGTLPLRSRPLLARNAADTEKLVWDRYCTNNLAVYLPVLFEKKKKDQELPRIGIAAKGCDLRSIFGLVKERQLPRENIVIVGLPCRGMADPVKMTALAGEVDGAAEEDALAEISEQRILQDVCLECEHPDAAGADVLIQGEPRNRGKQNFATVGSFEAKSAEERWRTFEAEVSKCIRCYACRQSCPNCYCKVCFADQGKPGWLSGGTHISDLMLFHIGRIFHQAGRCVGCNACLRACPMGVDLQIFTQKLVKDVQELFHYSPGLPLEEPPPLCTFKAEDSQAFISEP
ncbi:MAG: 4Fe-4S dicluster domain-containing protein [Spirochaetaceae bacterium]|nr:MAG: 4Fe-4S dicluster domain-containing protein [Spirochaetaceae bacterium]